MKKPAAPDHITPFGVWLWRKIPHKISYCTKYLHGFSGFVTAEGRQLFGISFYGDDCLWPSTNRAPYVSYSLKTPWSHYRLFRRSRIGSNELAVFDYLKSVNAKNAEEI